MIKLSKENENYTEEDLKFIEKNFETISGFNAVNCHLILLLQHKHLKNNFNGQNYFVIYTKFDEDKDLQNFKIYRWSGDLNHAVSDFGACVEMINKEFAETQVKTAYSSMREIDDIVKEKVMAMYK